jgi:hypothetical protein
MLPEQSRKDGLASEKARTDPSAVWMPSLITYFSVLPVVQVSRISDIVYGFTVRVPGRDYVLQAVSEAERAEWMVGLQNRCPVRQCSIV